MKSVKVWGIETYVMGSDNRWAREWFLTKEERDAEYETRVITSPSPVKKVRCCTIPEVEYKQWLREQGV